MLGRVVRGVMRRAAGAADLVARAFGQGALLLDLGPVQYRRHRRSIIASRLRQGAHFGNGVTTTLTPERAAGWHAAQGRPVVVVVEGDPRAGMAEWMTVISEQLDAHFLLSGQYAADLAGAPRVSYSVLDAIDRSPFDLASIIHWMHREKRRWDLVLVDASQPLLDARAIIQLQHAAYEYRDDDEIGFVSPAFSVDGDIIAGFDIDRSSVGIVPAQAPARDYGQAAIPRYVLTAPRHSFYATARALDIVRVPESELVGLSPQAQVSALVRHGWSAHIRTLCFSSTVVPLAEVPPLELSGDDRRWIFERSVYRNGVTRIVFVLNATSISGGIRAVFEVANGLQDRGFDVEIWSLQEQPNWFDLHVPVTTFRSYDDLLLSLRVVDAIKVATWWETAEVVWLASVNHGVPAYMIQEFETWFYPDDPIGQAAVVASYRREFASLTEASFQRDELAEVGVTATLIPHGFDPSVFRELPAVARRSDAVLALGRSFFQKNFAMTERAWRLLGESRPTLLLFGTEPGIVEGDRVEYHERPRDAEVNVLYNQATVFVQTSRHEGFCLPVLEAMAAGCPVITTDSHGNRDFCVDGENCVIVAQDDAAGLAAIIQRLLDDPETRDRLREGGRRTAAAYTWPVVLDRIADFYSSVAGGVSGTQKPATPAPEPSDHGRRQAGA